MVELQGIKSPHINKRYRIPKDQSKMDNPEKLKTQGTQDKQKLNTTCVGHHYTQTNTNNINKTYALLHTTRGKYEPNVVSTQKLQRKPQHRPQNVKRHNRTTQKTKRMSNTDPTKNTGVNSGVQKHRGELRCTKTQG